MSETPVTSTEYGPSRFMPRLYFQKRALPSHPPVAMDWMVDQLRSQVATSPAAEWNVDYIPLGDDDESFDGVGGKSVTYRPSALMLSYGINWLPTGVGGQNGWIFEYSRAAAQWIELDKVATQNRIAILEDEIKSSNLPAPEKKEKRDDLEGKLKDQKQALDQAQRAIEALEDAINSGNLSPEEATAKKAELKTAQENLKQLQNKAFELEDGMGALNLSREGKKTKQEELEDQRALLAQLGQNRESYAETNYQCLNSGVSGIFWKLQAANVQIKATSAFTLPQGRSISLRLRRLKAPKEQGRYNFTIFIANEKGDASTCYALRIGGDGNGSEFFHFRNMQPARRKALFAAWDALENFRAPTAEDRKKLLHWQDEEQKIRAAKKKSGQPFTKEQTAEIEALQEKAKTLMAEKKMTPEDAENKKTLERELFLERRPFQLQENANELLGKSVDMTFHFLRAGYVVIKGNDTTFVYENKRITGLKPPQYHEGLPEGCRLSIDSDGGMWRLVYGHPRYEQSGYLLSQPFAIPFDFNLEEAGTLFDGDDSRPGCALDVSLVNAPSGSGGNKVPSVPRYQLRIGLNCAGQDYSPEVYWAGFHLPAGDLPHVPPEQTPPPIYNSQFPGNPSAVSGNWIRDVVMQAGKERSPECTVHLGLQNNPAIDPPLNVAALVGDVILHDRKTEQNINVLRYARVASVPLSELRGLDVSASTLAPRMVKGSLAQYSLTGPLEWLDREVEAPFVLAKYTPNDALRALLRDGGLPEWVYERIPAGDIGIPPIPPTQPGRYPASKIAANAHLIEIAREVAEKYCQGWELVQDGAGLDLVPHGLRDRPELGYNLPPVVAVSSPLCLRQEFTLEQETREVVTGVTVYGAKDPFTGVRFSHTETLPLMYEPGNESSVYWTGHKNHKTLDPDDNLTSVTACVRVAREYLNITPKTPDGLAPWKGKAIINFDSTVRCGDIVRVFGCKFKVEDVDLGNLAADEKAGKMTLTLRLVEDRKLERPSEDENEWVG